MSGDRESALADLNRKIRAHCGARVQAIHHVDRSDDLEGHDRSDAELVVLLKDDRWRMFDEKETLGVWTFDAVLDHGVHIGAWPVPSTAWSDPDTAEYPSLVHEFPDHSRQLAVPA